MANKKSGNLDTRRENSTDNIIAVSFLTVSRQIFISLFLPFGLSLSIMFFFVIVASS